MHVLRSSEGTCNLNEYSEHESFFLCLFSHRNWRDDLNSTVGAITAGMYFLYFLHCDIASCVFLQYFLFWRLGEVGMPSTSTSIPSKSVEELKRAKNELK